MGFANFIGPNKLSSLIFHTESNQALIATDTLAVQPSGTPAFFTSKAFLVPHLRFVIAGTGLAGFATRWFVRVNDQMLVRGIDNLDFHTSSELRNLWKVYSEEVSNTINMTSTIYHIGFSEEDDLVRTYVYRSEKEFESEVLDYGLAVKPRCTVPEQYSLPNDLISMMDEQRTIQESEPEEQRIYIGGEIVAIHLTLAGATVSHISRFSDYDADLASMWHSYQRG